MADEGRIVARNKRAEYDYHILQQLTAGIQLTGTEVKSVRDGKASIAEGYCYFHRGELYVKNMHIPEYKMGGIHNHEPTRERKLLLSKRELSKLEVKVKERGHTIIPVELHITDRGWIKLDIALVKGKTKGDKRQSIKEKDIKREVEKNLNYKIR